MTQVSSNNTTVKNSFFTKAMLHNGIQNVKENMRLFIVILVLHMIAVPLLVTAMMFKIITTGYYDSEMYLVIGVMATGVATAAGMVCALSVFSYLYKKTDVDMHLSLPMTTLQRFVSDYLSGLFVYIVPFLISQVMSGILILAGHIFLDGRQFQRRYTTELWTCTAFEEFAPIWIKLVIGGLAIMLMFYALSILVSSCCGSLFECAAYNIIMNALLPLIMLMFIFIVTRYCYGLDEDYLILQTLVYGSPIGGVVGLCMDLFSGDVYGNVTVPVIFSFGKWLVIFLLVTVLMTAASWFVYRKRKAEDTGKPIVFGAFYHVIMTMALCVITYLFLLSETMGVPLVIITAVLYMVFTVIRNRGFARFKRGIAAYILTMVFSIGSYYIVSAIGEFGIADYIPSTAAIEKAYVSYQGYFNDTTYNDFGTSYTSEQILTLTEESDLEIITKAHSCAVSDQVSYNSIGTFRIMYVLKSGKMIIREYELNDPTVNILSELDMEQTTKQFRAEYSTKVLAQIEKDRKSEITSDTFNDYTDFIAIYPKWSAYANGNNVSNYSVLNVYMLPDNFFEELEERLYTDIINETEEDYFTPSGDMWYLRYCDKDGYVYGTVCIKENYTLTMEYLRACGYTKLPVTDAKTAEVLSMGDNALESHKVREKLAGEELVCSTTRDTSIKVKDGIDWYWMQTYQYSENTVYTDEWLELLQVAQKMYKTDESCYTIYVDGTIAVIPMEYSDMAERVYIFDTIMNFVSEYNSYTGYSYAVGERYYDFLSAFLSCYDKDTIGNVLDAYGIDDWNEIYQAMVEYIQQAA